MDIEVIEVGIQLCMQEIDWWYMYGDDVMGVLCGQCGDCGEFVYVMCCKGFQVGLDVCVIVGVGVGDGEGGYGSGWVYQVIVLWLL